VLEEFASQWQAGDSIDRAFAQKTLCCSRKCTKARNERVIGEEVSSMLMVLPDDYMGDEVK